MAARATQMIAIDGVTVNLDQVKKPGTRLFRDAWQMDGNVVSVDMRKARRIKAEDLADQAERRIEKNRRGVARAALFGEDTADMEQEITALRKRPGVNARQLLANAATVEELDAITLNDIFPKGA